MENHEMEDDGDSNNNHENELIISVTIFRFKICWWWWTEHVFYLFFLNVLIILNVFYFIFLNVLIEIWNIFFTFEIKKLYNSFYFCCLLLCAPLIYLPVIRLSFNCLNMDKILTAETSLSLRTETFFRD